MADYIKPFICDQKGASNSLKEKLEQSEEEKPQIGSGMGDFDYENLPSDPKPVDPVERALFDEFSDKTNRLFGHMEAEIAKNFEQRKNLEDKIANIEKEMEKRKRLYDLCLAMSKEESVEIAKYSQKNKKIDSTIHHLQQMTDSWQCLIDNFRKIPDESD